MEQKEFYDLLARINSIYGNFLPKEKTKKDLMVNAWWRALRECDFNKCCNRVIAYSRENTFPPKPKDVYVEPKLKDNQLKKNEAMFKEWSESAGEVKNFQKIIPNQFKDVRFSEEIKSERLTKLKQQAERLKK